MKNKKVLIIGLTWPEPDATAAGTRMIQLIHFFSSKGYKVFFASAASKSKLSYDFHNTPVSCFDIELNNRSFDKKITELDPSIVLFDRFLTEEQFGWRVQENCPDAIKILDTEDLHLLRTSRQLALKNATKEWKSYLNNDTSKREIASILKCDLSLIISEFEMQLLQNEFKIPGIILQYTPFLTEQIDKKSVGRLPGFKDRKHFMTIGNYKHLPNQDAIIYLYHHIWPLIRKALPKAEMHVYGAYVSNKVQQLHNPDHGFLIKGWAQDKQKVFQESKLCLAPLRFGAGQKGKLLDAMINGTPAITSSIGAESMGRLEDWTERISDDPKTFAEKAIALYINEKSWHSAQKDGFKIINENFNHRYHENLLEKKLAEVSAQLEKHRKNNFMGSLLQFHQYKSTKYLSKWIETKNLLDDKIIE
ncbi:glycosyltransferase [Lutimonas zeaxanthinifaciens]|uniref:glycosyltransferase n=1 Tax=Lutimonas zeaxanthinifaciens TaxID=3060215 RepID=UPI00265D27EA|nr:glycosyltransferase [Lutimonas sp. YSD2104]WKK64624.1 glycosyltransferase [Lutimonas sp. YSD2104]